MEVVEKEPEKTQEAHVLPENHEAEGGEESSVEVSEEEGPKRMISLQRDLTTLVTNIQTAADAKELAQRAELEEARSKRLERLENDMKSSQEKFEEIMNGWLIVNQKVILQDLHKALNSQQQSCATLIEDKRKLINELLQELKIGDERFVKNLRNNAEEMDLMIERMEEQITVLTETHREELAQIKKVHQQKFEVSLTKGKSEWEQHLKEVWEKEQEMRAERRKTVKEYEATCHSVMLENTYKETASQIENNEKLQVLERELQQVKGKHMIAKVKHKKHVDQEKDAKATAAYVKSKTFSLQAQVKHLKTQNMKQEKEIKRQCHILSEEYKREVQQYEHMQKKIKHFVVADARLFEEMWLMIEAEVKQLVEKALAIDSQICKHHLGLAWTRPPLAFMELSGPVQPQKRTLSLAEQLFQTGQASQRSQGVMDASSGPSLETDIESTEMEMHKEGSAVQSENGVEVEEGKLSMETLKEVMALLCDEADFLIEDKVLMLLAPLEKEDQTGMKLGSLLSSLGVEDKDVPKLADFLLKYVPRHREQREDVCAESSDTAEGGETSASASGLIQPNHVLPALKSFLEQHNRSRESSAHQLLSFDHLSRDASEDEAYWQSMGNIINEDKIKLWDAAESKLKQYHAVLTEISELVPETERLSQQNAELRTVLQQVLSTTVSWSHGT